MDTTSDIRVGLIGANVRAGWGGSVHARVIRALPGFELSAVATAHRETAEESAAHFGARLAFDDYRALAQSPEVDLVAIAVRVPFHFEMAMAALEAGKHVYCEWPLAATLEQAEELLRTARASGVRHAVGLQNRADPVYVEARALIEGGYVGEIVTCRLSQVQGGAHEREARRAYQADPSLGAHMLSITAGHAIDSFRFALGRPVRELSAQVRTRIPSWHLRDTGETVPTSSPDNILASAVLEGDVTASIEVVGVPYLGSGLALEVYGTEGTLHIAGGARGLELRGGRGATALELLPVTDREPVPESVAGGATGNVARVYQRLGRAITEGGEMEPSFETALSLHRILEAIQRSSDEGRRARID